MEGEMGVRWGRGGTSLDATLYDPVLAVPPTGACLVTLKNQWRLDLVKFLE